MGKGKSLLGVFSLLVIIFLFAFSSFLVDRYFDFFTKVIGESAFIGFIVYVLIIAFAAVAAPVSVIPLIPIASSQWGWVVVGFLTLLGESIGAFFSFFISRRYGSPLVRKFISLNSINKIERILPERHKFLGIVVLRVAIPVDIVSYALGLFSKVGWKTYSFATIIGFIPYAFVIAYLGELPFIYLINALLIGSIIFILILIIGVASHGKGRKKVFDLWSKLFR